MRHKLVLTFMLFGLAVIAGCEQVAEVDDLTTRVVEPSFTATLETIQPHEERPLVEPIMSDSVEATRPLDDIDSVVTARVEATRASKELSQFESTVVARVEATIVSEEPSRIVDRSVLTSELQSVQEAMDRYMESFRLAPTEQFVPTDDMRSSTPNLSPFMRSNRTKCKYTWDTIGQVAQHGCVPDENSPVVQPEATARPTVTPEPEYVRPTCVYTLHGIGTISQHGCAPDVEVESTRLELTSVAEQEIVQAAMDLYMADTGLAVSGQTIPTNDMTVTTRSNPELFPAYLRAEKTKCKYTWDATGQVTQHDCTADAADVELISEVDTTGIELLLVQAAMNFYMQGTGLAPMPQAVATDDMTTSTPVLSPSYLRTPTTECTYTWDASGQVTQQDC